MSYGFASHYGIGPQTTWGTAVAATEYFEALSESMATTYDRFDTRNIVGAFYEPDDSIGVERNVGDLVTAVNPMNIAHILRGAFGQSSVSSITAAFNLVEFTPRQSDISSVHPMPLYTVEIFRAGTLVSSSFQYNSVQFNTFQMNVAPNQDVRCTANMIAREALFIAKTTPSFPGSPLEPLLFSTVSMSVGGTGNTKIENLTISLDNQLEGQPALNQSALIARVRRNGPPQVRVSGQIDFQDLSEFLDFQNQTERRITFSATKAASFQLIYDIPRFVYTAVPVSIPGRERLTISFEGTARYHSGSGNAIKASLKCNSYALT